MMDGRVKTLHPNVHGGLLALRDKKDHADAMKAHGIEGIDLLVCNLYPFEATVARGADFETTIENIDIGGPAMTRSAAKIHDWVTVVVDAEDYKAVLDEMAAMAAPPPWRCAGCWPSAPLPAPPLMMPRYRTGSRTNWKRPATRIRRAAAAFGGLLRQPLRYGENPHQEAAFYVDGRHAPASPPPTSFRARSFPTTISTTPTRPMSWWRSSIPKSRPPAPSSSMPIPVAWRWARR